MAGGIKRYVGITFSHSLFNQVFEESVLLGESQSETVRRILFKYFRDKYGEDIALELYELKKY